MQKSIQFWFASGIALCSLAKTSPAPAQPVPDATLPVNSVVTTQGNTSTITGGTRAGRNLFHSFSEFSVPTRGVAFFNNAPSIQNIISRVTGGSISNIDGLLRANSTANLFLINPNGIIFGPNASLNIGGSFLASTASSLKLADGKQFSATSPQTTPLLTISVPIGLQFGANPGRIEVQGIGYDLSVQDPIFSPIIRGSSSIGLRVPQGLTLALVGGDIDIEGGTLTAEQGRIELGSVGGNGQVNLNPIPQGFTLSYQGLQSFRDIRLSQQALADASGGGSIQVQGDHVSLTDGSNILIQNQGFQRGGSISVNAAESFEVSGINPDGRLTSGLDSQNEEGGSGADIAISTQQLVMQGGGSIATSSRSTGKAGNVTVNATDSVRLIGFPPINPALNTSISALAFSSGEAGDITVSTGRLTGMNGGQISSGTFGTGHGGHTTVNALDSIELIGQTSLFSPSGLNATTLNAGDAGDLTVNTSRLAVRDGANVNSVTLGTGNAGSVTINARETVEVSGKLLSSPTPTFIGSSALIPAATLQAAYRIAPVPSGYSGNVEINTHNLSVTGGAIVDVRNEGVGNAGTLRVNAANSIFLDQQGSITAATAFGEGGNISLKAQNLQLSNNSAITASVGRTGNGGNIMLNTDILAALENSNITANAVQGRGGNIQINTQGIFRSPDSAIIASSQLGINGTVQINTLVNDPSRGLVALPVILADTSKQIAQGCAAGNRTTGSRFIVTGRGGLPANPGEPLSSDTVWSDTRLLAATLKPQHSQTGSAPKPSTPPAVAIVPATGWVLNGKGEVILTASVPSDSIQVPWLTPASCHTQ